MSEEEATQEHKHKDNHWRKHWIWIKFRGLVGRQGLSRGYTPGLGKSLRELRAIGGSWALVRVPVSSFVYFLKEEKVSWSGVRMACMNPITLLSLSVSKSRRRRMDQKTDQGINDMASRKATNAMTGPALTC